MGHDEAWNGNPLYEAADWQENALYEPTAEDPNAALEGVARLFPSEARMALDAQLHARDNQELQPIDTDNPMEDPGVMKDYVSRTLRARETWDDAGDPGDAVSIEERRRAMVTGAAGHAASQAHPGLNVEYVTEDRTPGMEITDGVAGMTNPWTGQVLSDPSGFADAELTGDTVNTVYHETTHAEQVALVRDVSAQGGAVTDREVDINYEMNINLGTSIVNPEPDTTMWVESHAGQSAADDVAYRALRAEREAWAAGDAAGRMYNRVSAVHDELREHFDARERAQNFAELPQVDPTEDA